ncbi:MAG TPA: hypothetical protein DEO67_02915 [Candidatus Edwardsbacteria bacterium]|nr:hypothetical protein [Candidatus Edwardsbacteria bacterium]
MFGDLAQPDGGAVQVGHEEHALLVLEPLVPYLGDVVAPPPECFLAEIQHRGLVRGFGLAESDVLYLEIIFLFHDIFLSCHMLFTESCDFDMSDLRKQVSRFFMDSRLRENDNTLH